MTIMAGAVVRQLIINYQFSIINYAEPHAGGGADVVVDHGAAAGHPCLLAVDGGELVAAGVEDALHVGKGLGVLVKLAVEELAEGLLGDIVLGGAKAAGHEHHVATFQTVKKIGRNVVGIVADDVSATHIDAGSDEHLRHAGSVGVHHLSDKKLVAYVKNCCFHAAIRKIEITPNYFKV